MKTNTDRAGVKQVQIEATNASANKVSHAGSLDAPHAPRARPSSRSEPLADAATISERSRELAALRAHFDELPDVRADLVSDLKARVEAGTYQPPSRRVAASMLAELGHFFAE